MKTKKLTNGILAAGSAIITLILTLALARTTLAADKYYNFGVLDIRPLITEESQSREWFVEFLAPGETAQKRFIVSNFSPVQKTVSLYVSDTSVSETSVNEDSTFFVKSAGEKSEDVSAWIKLPANSLTLEPGQAKAVTAEFKIPETAGIGLHTGAIIARDNGEEISFEKGIRVYLNVIGPAITKAEPSQIVQTQSAANLSYGFAIENKGTTDFRQNYTSGLFTIFGEPVESVTQNLQAKRGETGTAVFTFKKPSYGFYKVSVSDGKTASVIGTILFIPFWVPLLAILLIALAGGTQRSFSGKTPRNRLGLLPPASQNPFRSIRPALHSPSRLLWPACENLSQSLRTTFQNTFLQLQPAFQAVAFKRSVAYFALFAVIVSSLSIGAGFHRKTMASHPIAAIARSYDLTVKWGEFRQFRVPESYRKDWKGKIMVSNGTFIVKEMLHLEKNDSIEVSGDGRMLNYRLTTGPDNDGVILKVSPTTDEAPIITYSNEISGEMQHFKITDNVNKSRVYPDVYWGAQFSVSSEALPKTEQPLRIVSAEDLSATPEMELEATPDKKPAFIPELENLFIEDLPATPEILTDIILKSHYIKAIEKENGTTKLETDSILIEALEATPEILEQIMATPDLNFIFIPSEPVSFPRTEFSFSENRIVEQSLGTLIFIQKKETPWNTYVGTTDFASLSSDSVIPASALTINPGEVVTLKEKEQKIEKENGTTLIKNVGKTEITKGKQRQFTGKFDKTLLVDVRPDDESEQIFTLNPVLRIFIPAGTVAGRYRGQLTITSL